MRDFEDEWEAIGRYLLNTGWSVEEYRQDERDLPIRPWEYTAFNHQLGLNGGIWGSVSVRGNIHDLDPDFSVFLRFPVTVRLATRGRAGAYTMGEEGRHQQQDVFLVALSDLFDDVEAMQRGASPIEIRFSARSSEQMRVEGFWRPPPHGYENICSFREVPSAEDAIAIIEAFALTQREMGRRDPSKLADARS